MANNNDKKSAVSTRYICIFAGIVCAICGIYWLVRALFFEDTNLSMILSSLCVSMFLFIYANRKQK